MANLTFGSYAFTTPVLTILDNGVKAKANGGTTSLHLQDFTHADNRLTYTGTVTRVFEVTMAISGNKAAAGQPTNAVFYIAKNGVVQTNLRVIRTVGSGDSGAMAVLGTVDLATNDYIELWLETDTGDDFTINAGVVTVKVLG